MLLSLPSSARQCRIGNKTKKLPSCTSGWIKGLNPVRPSGAIIILVFPPFFLVHQMEPWEGGRATHLNFRQQSRQERGDGTVAGRVGCSSHVGVAIRFVDLVEKALHRLRESQRGARTKRRGSAWRRRNESKEWKTLKWKVMERGEARCTTSYVRNSGGARCFKAG